MKVYISASTTQGYEIRCATNLLREGGHTPSHHVDGDTYDIDNLKKADAVVFVLPSNSWSYPIHKLTQGVLRELVFCINQKKDIFIAYRTQSGLKIYAAEIDEDLCIRGIQATYMNLDTLNALEETKIEPSEEHKLESNATYKRFY